MCILIILIILIAGFEEREEEEWTEINSQLACRQK